MYDMYVANIFSQANGGCRLLSAAHITNTLSIVVKSISLLVLIRDIGNLCCNIL